MNAQLITLGCQMNEYDSHIVSSQLVALGIDLVDYPEAADLVLINSCAVRGKPVERVRSLLGRLREMRASRPLLIGLLGCLAQLEEGQRIAKEFAVDFLLGPGALLDLGSALEAGQPFRSLRFQSELDTHIPPPPQGKLQAYLTIMRGCDHHCTYCVVPTTRGKQVSRPLDSILRELDSLLEAGILEVTLLGQNVNSYGLDQGKRVEGTPSFAELLRTVGRSGVRRIKFTTSHPMNFTEDVVLAMRDTPAVCDLIHLPVQSGSDAVLRRMGREYTRERYLEHVALIRRHLQGAALTTDLIVGFPGETEQDFADTLSIYEEVGYDAAYTFLYSARPGTPSQRHFQDLPKEVKVERLKALVEVQKRWALRRNTAYVGREIEVLLRGEAQEPGYLEGHSRAHHPVLVQRSEAVSGPGLYRVRVGHATPHLLFAQAG